MNSATKLISFEKIDGRSLRNLMWHLGVGLVVFAALQFWASTALAQIVIVQEPGTDYLAWEAEDFDRIENGDDTTGFLVVDNIGVGDDNTFTTGFGSAVLPEDTNAGRGTAVYDQPGGGDQDLVHYKLQFAEPGLYFIYMHYSMYERSDPTGYGQEDSIFLPREFGVSPIGPRGDNNWWASTPAMGSTPGDGFWEGNFHWWMVTGQADDTPPTMEWTPDVGTVLDFAVAAREAGTTLDKFVMSTNPSLTSVELDAIIPFAPNTGDPGDFNADGVVDLADFMIMAANFNESFRVPESFAKGDQTRDGRVDLADYLEARPFFNAAQQGAAASVPEPAGLILTVAGVVMTMVAVNRRRRQPAHRLERA